eukprot:1448732-Amphidinium_carterae.1
MHSSSVSRIWPTLLCQAGCTTKFRRLQPCARQMSLMRKWQQDPQGMCPRSQQKMQRSRPAKRCAPTRKAR